MRKIIKIIVTLFLSIVTLVFFSGCGEETGHIQTGQNKKIRLALAMQPSSSLIMIALENGYFKKNGLDIEILEFPSGKRALLNGLFKDKVDVATSSDVPIAVSMLDGLDFQIAAIIVKAENINRVIARKDAGINKPSDLLGKRIGTQRASAVHFFLHLFMGEHGIPNNDVEISFMKAENLPTALAIGEIDAFSMREPYITQAMDLLGDNCIVFSEPGLYSQIDAVLIDKSMLHSSPETVDRFIRALIEAENFAFKNAQKAIDIISKKLGVPTESIAKIWPELKLRVSLEQSHVLLLEDIARWVIKEGLTEKKDLPNSLNYIYFNGLESTKPDSITITR